MKKNNMMRLASVLLIAVILSTCAVSGTFAKYVTESTGTDKARVAYWGFENGTSIDFDLFSTTYDGTVSSSENVVAPGTSQTETFNFVYSKNNTSLSAPEVKYTFAIKLENTGTTTSLDNNTNFMWSLKMPGETTATYFQTVSELETAIESMSGTYEAGTLPASTDTTNHPNAKFSDNSDNTFEIGWKWAFDNTDTVIDGTTAATDLDTTDTEMGNAASLADINFTLTITATQVN